jgi:hypothetical protein
MAGYDICTWFSSDLSLLDYWVAMWLCTQSWGWIFVAASDGLVAHESEVGFVADSNRWISPSIFDESVNFVATLLDLKI